jgi:hypothetical protein
MNSVRKTSFDSAQDEANSLHGERSRTMIIIGEPFSDRISSEFMMRMLRPYKICEDKWENLIST